MLSFCKQQAACTRSKQCSVFWTAFFPLEHISEVLDPSIQTLWSWFTELTGFQFLFCQDSVQYLFHIWAWFRFSATYKAAYQNREGNESGGMLHQWNWMGAECQLQSLYLPKWTRVPKWNLLLWVLQTRLKYLLPNLRRTVRAWNSGTPAEECPCFKKLT